MPCDVGYPPRHAGVYHEVDGGSSNVRQLPTGPTTGRVSPGLAAKWGGIEGRESSSAALGTQTRGLGSRGLVQTHLKRIPGASITLGAKGWGSFPSVTSRGCGGIGRRARLRI